MINTPIGLRLSDFDYDLPPELIAQYPLAQRDQSRMLVLNRQTGDLTHRFFHDLPDLLQPNDLIVLNNTRVIPARLLGHRQGHTGKVEVFLLHADPDDPHCWEALLKPSRKLVPGTVVVFPGTTSTAVVETRTDGTRSRVRFHLKEFGSVLELMESIGHIPIPPYLNRPAEEADKETYQTVFSKVPGAQAAPTAGLHFTPQILETLKNQGVSIAEVTLAVSSGTFRSIMTEDITEHQMDPEYYTIPPETVTAIQRTQAQGGRVFAIGTTVAKTLETAAVRHQGTVTAESAWSDLFIYPGFQFQVIDGLLTNFHLPKTTLMLLVSAFANREQILSAYHEAVQARYRFFSYGDCMLIV